MDRNSYFEVLRRVDAPHVLFSRCSGKKNEREQRSNNRRRERRRRRTLLLSGRFFRASAVNAKRDDDDDDDIDALLRTNLLLFLCRFFFFLSFVHNKTTDVTIQILRPTSFFLPLLVCASEVVVLVSHNRDLITALGPVRCARLSPRLCPITECLLRGRMRVSGIASLVCVRLTEMSCQCHA